MATVEAHGAAVGGVVGNNEVEAAGAQIETEQDGTSVEIGVSHLLNLLTS